MERISPCPNCGRSNIYLSKVGMAGGGYAPNYLPGLGGFFRYAKLYPSICGDCGLTRFFTDEDARGKLQDSPKWEKQHTRRN